MKKSKKLTFRAFGAGVLMAAAVTSPASAQDAEYEGTLAPLNDSGASGDIAISVDGTTLTVTANVDGVADLVHAQHLHGEFGFDNECPTTSLDGDGDGFISTVEGVPAYGAVKVSLTTAGDTSEAYALAVESFPVAEGGSYTYTRTFDVPAESAEGLDDLMFIVHGLDIDDSGAYDGDALSSLSEDLPLEATVPIACAKIVATSVDTTDTPVGGVAAGAGGAADSSDDGLAGPVTTAVSLAAILAAGGGALMLARQKRVNR